MLVADIVSTSTGRPIKEIEIPENEKEIKYSQFLEFSYKAQKLFEWLEIERESNRLYETQYVLKVCEIVASVIDVDPNILKNLKYNEQEWIWQAWNQINAIIKNFTPDENGGKFSIVTKVEGIRITKDFEVPKITKSLIRNELNLDTMTIHQVEEIGYIEKRLSDVVKVLEDKERKENTDESNTIIANHFTYALMKIAICLHDPMTIPVDATFDRWLDEKVTEIKDISMKDALNTIFFLTGLPKGYGILIDLNIILKRFLLESTQAKIQSSIETE